MNAFFDSPEHFASIRGTQRRGLTDAVVAYEACNNTSPATAFQEDIKQNLVSWAGDVKNIYYLTETYIYWFSVEEYTYAGKTRRNLWMTRYTFNDPRKQVTTLMNADHCEVGKKFLKNQIHLRVNIYPELT